MDNGVTINRPRMMATWRLFAHLMVSLSSFCKKVKNSALKHLGTPWKILVSGNSMTMNLAHHFFS